MFIRLFALFIIVPLLELYVLITIGKYIGAIPTILIVVIAGMAGIALLKREGFKVLNDFKKALYEGKVPGDEILNGILVLVGGVFLITPGLITDVIGFLLLIPFTRMIIKNWVKKFLYNSIKNGTIKIFLR